MLDNYEDVVRQVAAACERMVEGAPGYAYLAGRGLTPDTIALYGFGCCEAYHPRTREAMPAVAIPWYRRDELRAVRYRFINPADRTKITSARGSAFRGAYYGGHALRGGRFLLVTEGEINCASAAQACREAGLGVDVLSVGGESSALTEAMIAFAARYEQCVFWLDKLDLAESRATWVPGALGVSGPNGLDANDVLVRGNLPEYIEGVMHYARQHKERNTERHREAQERRRAQRAYMSSAPDADVERAYALLQRLAHWRRDDRDSWLRVGFALTPLGEQGLALWQQWSRPSPKFVEGECEKAWRGFSTEGVGFGTLVYMAEQDDPSGLARERKRANRVAQFFQMAAGGA